MDEFKKHFPNIEDNFVTDFNEYLKLIPNSSQFDHNDIALIYKALYKADYLHKNSKPRISKNFKILNLYKNSENVIVSTCGSLSIKD